MQAQGDRHPDHRGRDERAGALGVVEVHGLGQVVRVPVVQPSRGGRAPRGPQAPQDAGAGVAQRHGAHRRLGHIVDRVFRRVTEGGHPAPVFAGRELGLTVGAGTSQARRSPGVLAGAGGGEGDSPALGDLPGLRAGGEAGHDVQTGQVLRRAAHLREVGAFCRAGVERDLHQVQPAAPAPVVEVEAGLPAVGAGCDEGAQTVVAALFGDALLEAGDVARVAQGERAGGRFLHRLLDRGGEREGVAVR